MNNLKTLALIIVISLIAVYIALPEQIFLDLQWGEFAVDQSITIPRIDFFVLGRRINPDFRLRKGLDIQGGTRVTLAAEMDEIESEDRSEVLHSVRDILRKRIEIAGISELRIQTAAADDSSTVVVEIPAGADQEEVLQLISQTAWLDFRLQTEEIDPEEVESEAVFISSFEPVELDSSDLDQASINFGQQVDEPFILLEFNRQGAEKLAEITQESEGRMLAVFVDGFPIAIPVIEGPILDGRAIIAGGFNLETAERLTAQLNAGRLPANIEVAEIRSIGAGLGETEVRQSLRAGAAGLSLVVFFMVAYYGFKGLISSLVLAIFIVLNIAVYKIIGLTITLPALAGLLLTIGIAVDSNIIIFERMKDELRSGFEPQRALQLSFAKALDSIQDANLVLIITAIVLINPLDFSLFNTSGAVKTFGSALLIGVLVSLFTGTVVSNNFLQILLPVYSNLKLKLGKE